MGLLALTLLRGLLHPFLKFDLRENVGPPTGQGFGSVELYHPRPLIADDHRARVSASRKWREIPKAYYWPTSYRMLFRRCMFSMRNSATRARSLA